MKTLCAAVLLAMVTLFTTGCGGDSGPLDEDEYVERFDEICTDTVSDVSDLEDEFLNGDDADLDTLSDNYAARQERIDEAVAELEDLTPPEDLELQADAAVDALEATSAVFGDLVALIAEEPGLDELRVLQNETLPDTFDAFVRASQNLGSSCFGDPDDFG